MAKDDPMTPEEAREVLRKWNGQFAGWSITEAIRVLTEDEAAPEPEPIPPGKLVIEDPCTVLEITTATGLTFLSGELDRMPQSPVRLATGADVIEYCRQTPGTILLALQDYARLVVSQEQPPVLIDGDEKNYVVIEKRICNPGDLFLNSWNGRVYEHPGLLESALPVWIVTKKQ